LQRRISIDISLLLVLQDFRNGPGAFLAGFLSKMTWLVHRISDRLDSGKAVCSVFHRYFHDEKSVETYIRTVKLLCCQPDIRTCNQRLDFRSARHLCFMLSADVLRVIPLSLDNEALREAMMLTICSAGRLAGFPIL
jgi:hypothetical protein